MNKFYDRNDRREMSKVLQNNKSSPTIYTPIHYISNDTIIRICHFLNNNFDG